MTSLYTFEVEIPVLPRLPNQLLGAKWRTRAGHAKKWEHLVWRYCWHLRPTEPLKRARLTLTRFSSRRPDFDGLVGSFKSPLDALVKLGVLADDAHEVIGVPEYLHEHIGACRGKIKIIVEGINNE